MHQRISELRKEGQWSASRLPRLVEASRPKSHWDYLLEEMQWMAADFAQERRWKEAAAKKVRKRLRLTWNYTSTQQKEWSVQKTNAMVSNVSLSLFAHVHATIKSGRKVRSGQRKKGRFIFVTLPAQLPERWNSSGLTLSRYSFMYLFSKWCHCL